MITNQTKMLTTREVAGRFNELAQQEKWMEIQDEFFSNDIRSIDPADSPYFGNAEGLASVKRKGQEFIKRIEGVHKAYTSEPIVTGNHFAVVRELDMTVEGHGRIQLNQIMLYEVKKGKIVLEQFFY